MSRASNGTTPRWRKPSSLDDRISEPCGVRDEGWISLSGCHPNRVQASLGLHRRPEVAAEAARRNASAHVLDGAHRICAQTRCSSKAIRNNRIIVRE
jgi:hypothetical protein